MNKSLFYITLTAASMVTGTGLAMGGLGGGFKGGLLVNTCIGSNPTCPGTVTVNAVGDTAVIDVTKYKVTSFGQIKEDTDVKLAVPLEKNAMNIYSFKPTAGELAGKTIYLALDNIAPRLGSIYTGQDVVKLYSQHEGQKTSEWATVGNIRGNFQTAAVNGKIELQFTIKPDGTLIGSDPATKKEIDYPLGKSNLIQ